MINHLTTRDAQPGVTVGFDLDERVRDGIALLPGKVSPRALGSTGAARDDADIAEFTGLIRYSHLGDKMRNWTAGMRILVRHVVTSEDT